MATVFVTSGTIIHAGATYRPGETFDIEAGEAARLVKLGVAEIVAFGVPASAGQIKTPPENGTPNKGKRRK